MLNIHRNFLLSIKIAPNNAFDSMFQQQTLAIEHITFDLCTDHANVC